MSLKTNTDEPPTLNLVPMIDVVFLLLLFLMVSTRFAQLERKISLQVPAVADRGALTTAPERRVVNVYQDGTVTLDHLPVSIEELTARLAAARNQYNDLGVLVRGDAKGEFQRVATALNACKQAGIRELGISVRLVGPEKPK